MIAIDVLGKLLSDAEEIMKKNNIDYELIYTNPTRPKETYNEIRVVKVNEVGSVTQLIVSKF